MCSTTTPVEAPNPDVQTFESTEALLAAIKPGMDLCTSDFTGWADITEIKNPEAGKDAIVVGTVREGGATVHVPAGVLLEIRGGHCVRLDRVRATINDQGWEV
ncbi:MAG: hypothetical protein ACK5H2_08140 [Beutenbergiaceae bacterium]